MLNINNKVDFSSSNVENHIAAGEFNILVNNINQLIADSGNTLSDSSTDQILKAIDVFAKNIFYVDDGIVNNISLSKQSLPQVSYEEYTDGMTIMVYPGTTNTGSLKIKIGDLLYKDVVNFYDEPMTGGEVKMDMLYIMIYDSALDKFKILTISDSLNQNNTYASASGDGSEVFNTANATDPTHMLNLETATAMITNYFLSNVNTDLNVTNNDGSKKTRAVDGEFNLITYDNLGALVNNGKIKIVEDTFNSWTTNLIISEDYIKINGEKVAVASDGSDFIYDDNLAADYSSGELFVSPSGKRYIVLSNNGKKAWYELYISKLLDINWIITLHRSSFFINDFGELYGCGYDILGQLGLVGGTSIITNYFQTIMTDVKRVFLTYQSTMIIKNDDTVWVCGDNRYGQLGLGYRRPEDSTEAFYEVPPVQVPNLSYSDIKAVSINPMPVILMKDGSVMMTNRFSTDLDLLVGESAGTEINVYTKIPYIDNITREDRFSNRFYIEDTGDMKVITYNLDLATLDIVLIPNLNADRLLPTIKDYTSGSGMTDILFFDISGDAYMLGRNYNGTHGTTIRNNREFSFMIGTGTYSYTITKIDFHTSKIHSFISQDNNTFILFEDGTLWVSGSNSNGILGLGHSNKVYEFTQVTGVDRIIKMAVKSSLVVLTDKGEVYATGSNHYGQLGVGDDTDRAVLTKVINVTDVVDIVVGYMITYYLERDGTIKVAGEGRVGQTGLGGPDTTSNDIGPTLTPTIIPGYERTLSIDNLK